MGRLIGPIALYVLLGVPLVAYVWEALNVLFTGRVELLRLGIAAIAAIVLVGLFKLMARTVTRWKTERSANVAPPRQPPAARGP
jgi:hypothetical protein